MTTIELEVSNGVHDAKLKTSEQKQPEDKSIGSVYVVSTECHEILTVTTSLELIRNLAKECVSIVNPTYGTLKIENPVTSQETKCNEILIEKRTLLGYPGGS